MDYKEKFEKVWNYIETRLAEIDRGDDEFDWGMKSAFEEVLDFMDELPL